MSSLHSPSTTRRSTPSRRGRAGLAIAAVLLTVAPLATACGAGFNSAATQVKLNSGSGSIGALKINNVWVLVDPSSNNAEVIGAVSNNGSADVNWPTVQVDDAATQIVAGGASGSPSTGAATGSAAQSIAAGQTTYFGQPGQPQIQLSAAGLTLGDLAKVTFSFGDGGTVTVQAQIQSNTGQFADYNPNPASPSPSASPSASASASSSASSSASASASASASPTSSKKETLGKKLDTEHEVAAAQEVTAGQVCDRRSGWRSRMRERHPLRVVGACRARRAVSARMSADGSAYGSNL